MNGNAIGAIVVLVIIIVGGWFLFRGTPAQAPTTEVPVTNQMPVVGSTTPEMIVENVAPATTVTYTDQGFSPKEVSIAQGTTVTFVNQSSGKMWVASAKHPDHTVYSGTSLSQHCPDTTNAAFDECAGEEPGATFSFTFGKAGTWKYHDHLNSKMFGSIVVTAATTTTAQ